MGGRAAHWTRNPGLAVGRSAAPHFGVVCKPQHQVGELLKSPSAALLDARELTCSLSLRVILDLHQDALGTANCGEGVPTVSLFACTFRHQFASPTVYCSKTRFL